MQYQPFLIAPFSHGLNLDIEPWLLPQDGFDIIEDGHIYNGKVEKRRGYRKFGEIVHNNGSDWDISNITGTSPGTLTVTVTDTTGLSNGDTVEFRNLGGSTELNGEQYEIAGVTATTFTITVTEAISAYTSGGEVYLLPQERVMGLWRYIDSNNVKDLLAFDTKRAAIYNSSSEQFDPLDSADIFSSSNTDYVWATNWANTSSSTATTLFRMYFTNGKSNGGGTTDGIRYYDPAVSTTSTTQFNPQINSSVEIRGCKLIFAFQERLVLLHTFEGANTYPQRARWCRAQNPNAATSWDDNVAGEGGYVDAPTGDQIISAQFLQDFLLVFFTESVWALKPTQDPALPFLWQKVNNFRSCDAKMASEQFDKVVVSTGIRGIVATDGFQSQRIDDRISLFVKENIDATEFNKCFMKRSFSFERMWLLYVGTVNDSLDDDANKALIYDERSQSFSIYNIPMNVLGYGAVATDLLLSDFPDNEEEAAESGLPIYADEAGDLQINDFVTDELEEIFIGGDRNGNIYYLEQNDGDDDGASIGFELQSAAWNPYKQNGQSCQLGYIDFYVESNDETTFEVEFFKDNDESPYQTTRVNCLPNIMEIAEISDITIKTPATNGVTVVAYGHGLSDGDQIYIYNVDGMTEINGVQYEVSNVTDNTFDIAVDATNWDAYTNDGLVAETQSFSSKAWKRVYAGGIGHQHKIRITSEGIAKPLVFNAFMPWFRKVGRRLI